MFINRPVKPEEKLCYYAKYHPAVPLSADDVFKETGVNPRILHSLLVSGYRGVDAAYFPHKDHEDKWLIHPVPNLRKKRPPIEEAAWCLMKQVPLGVEGFLGEIVPRVVISYASESLIWWLLSVKDPRLKPMPKGRYRRVPDLHERMDLA